MEEKVLFVVVLANVVASIFAQILPEYDHGLALNTTQPLIVAHRGASGVYPEHTLPAYQLAVDQGSDMIECDLCVTRDLQLVCLHESWMSGISNVADVYDELRMNTYFVFDQGRNITDYFTVDFTLAELKSVSLRQRYSYRDQSFDDMFPIVAFEELIDIVQSADTGKIVGLTPEIKDPQWVNSLDFMQEAGVTFESLLVDVLERRGYSQPTDPCVIFCFIESTLVTLSALTDLPLLMLRGSGVFVSDADLERYSTFAWGLGPNKNIIVRVGIDNKINDVTDLAARAHAYGLRVLPYTARNEYNHLAFDYEQDPLLEYQTLLEAGCDGVITDFPATYKRYLDGYYCQLEN